MHRDYPLGVAQHSAGSVMLDLASDTPIHTEWWRTLSWIGGDVFADAVCAAADETRNPVVSIEALIACARLGEKQHMHIEATTCGKTKTVTVWIPAGLWAMILGMGRRPALAFFGRYYQHHEEAGT